MNKNKLFLLALLLGFLVVTTCGKKVSGFKYEPYSDSLSYLEYIGADFKEFYEGLTENDREDIEARFVKYISEKRNNCYPFHIPDNYWGKTFRDPRETCIHLLFPKEIKTEQPIMIAFTSYQVSLDSIVNDRINADTLSKLERSKMKNFSWILMLNKGEAEVAEMHNSKLIKLLGKKEYIEMIDNPDLCFYRALPQSVLELYLKNNQSGK